MKRIKFFAIAAVALIVGMTSCSKENAGGEIESGERSFISVSMNFPKATEARALADPNAPIARALGGNATDAEATVKSVHVFIFSASGNFLSVTPLLPTDFTPLTAADKYVSSTPIPTTTGIKNVFVGVNLPATVVTAIKGGSMADLKTVSQTLLRANMTDITTNGLAMFSTVAVNHNVIASADGSGNKLDVTVQRLVAKVTVEYTSPVEQSGVLGTLGTLEFAVNNFNERGFMIQAADLKDPNWASYGASDFSVLATDYAAILDKTLITAPEAKDYTPRYAMENSSEKKNKGEITRVTIRATFTPTSSSTWDGTDLTPDATPIAAGTTYWTVVPAIGSDVVFFRVQSEADLYAIAKGTTAVEYTGGMNYWNIYLNKNGKVSSTGVVNPSYKWDIFRNDVFQCTITKVFVPGRYTPEIVDPEATTPPDEVSNIQVDINIKPWHTPILDDFVLEP